MKIVPFLRSKNQSLEYGSVVIHEFFQQGGGGREAFLRTTTDAYAPPDTIYHLEKKGTPDGDVHFFYRQNDTGRVDEIGRPVSRIEGICVYGKDADQFVFNPHYLDEAEKLNNPHFEDFWTWEKKRPPISVTDEIVYDPDQWPRAGKLTTPPVSAFDRADPFAPKGGTRAERLRAAGKAAAEEGRSVGFNPVIMVSLAVVITGVLAIALLNHQRQKSSATR